MATFFLFSYFCTKDVIMRKIYVSLLVLSSSFLIAQQEKEQVIDSLHLVSRLKVKKEREAFVNNAQSTKILQEYDLERNNPSFLEQSLGIMAGVQVEKRTQFGGQRVVVRGYGNDQKFNNWGVKFYLNDIPLTNADGVTILEDIDFSQINGIEVIKGPAGTKYGGGAGGVVKFSIIPNLQQGTSISQRTTFGSFGLFQTNTKVENVSDKSSIMFNYGHTQSDGYRPRGNTNKNNYTFLGNFKLNPKQEMLVYASHNNSFEGVTGQISLQDYYQGKDPGNLAYGRKNAANHFISSRVLVSHKWNILSDLTNNTSIFYHHLDTKRTAAGAAENSQQPSYGVRSVFQWKKDIRKDFNINIEAGAEYTTSRSLISNYRFDGTVITPDLKTRPISKASYFKYNNYAVSLFLVNRLSYLPWELDFVAGVSGNTLGYDRTDLLAYPGLVKDYNKNLSFQKNFSTEFSPHFAFQKKWKKHIFNLSYSQGYNSPTANTAYIAELSKTNDNLKVERASMWDFSVQGTLAQSRFDYQVSLFNINIDNKLTKLWNGVEQYSYWSNTGHQRNKGIEMSLGYSYTSPNFFKKIEPYANFALYDFKYRDFKYTTKKATLDYSGNNVVGVPSLKYSIGLDIDTKLGFYMRNTFNYLGKVYTDFANEIEVKGFPQYNAKIGYKTTIKNWDIDAYIAGNNLTSHINYTFIFVGNAVGDSDLGNGYPANVTTDVNPGPAKRYFFGGLNIKYRF